jgi:hypothetical protein
MTLRLRDLWLARALFTLTLGAALALIGAVLLAPWLVGAGPDHPLLVLYANDATVRRTSLASALGLTATAFVFFRPSRKLHDAAAAEETQPESTRIAGA